MQEPGSGSVRHSEEEICVGQDETEPPIWNGLRLLIYVSMSGIGTAFDGTASAFLKGAIASFEGVFLRWQDADRHGRHPNPAVRPISTQDDDAWMGFYEVTDLKSCHVPSSVAPLGRKRAAGWIEAPRTGSGHRQQGIESGLPSAGRSRPRPDAQTVSTSSRWPFGSLK